MDKETMDFVNPASEMGSRRVRFAIESRALQIGGCVCIISYRTLCQMCQIDWY